MENLEDGLDIQGNEPFHLQLTHFAIVFLACCLFYRKYVGLQGLKTQLRDFYDMAHWAHILTC